MARDDIVTVHIRPLADALVTGKPVYQPNPESDGLSDDDYHELNRLGQVIAANLGCEQTPVPTRQEFGIPLKGRAPCYTCRMEAMRAMMLYLDIHGEGEMAKFVLNAIEELTNEQRR